MRTELRQLREAMKVKGIDLYIIPTTDYHGSEYVNDYFKFREYISGFTGSAGTLIVKENFAGLWTDGRYFLQAEEQLAGSGITLMKMGEQGVPTIEVYLNEQQPGTVIGFDGRVISHKTGTELEAKFTLVYDLDLADEVWEERPEIVPSEIYALDISVTGEEYEEKLKRLRSQMGDADYLLLSRLEEIAWLYNLRGNDINHTPVFYGFSFISKNDAVLYVKDETFYETEGFGDIKPYENIFGDLKELRNCRVMLDENSVSYSVFKSFDSTVDKILCKSPAEKMKAVKNSTEIAATKNAHIRDGAAMAKFICWLKNNIGKTEITEISAADYLERCRREQGAYDLSFTTISGYQEHGAIVHYAVTEQSDVKLKPEGFLLVDSGGQYSDGTTDITRTIALGSLEQEQSENYTAVLKGHIALAVSEFEEGTTGSELDEVARKPLKDRGLDFNHGTGHGVGHLLSVHEGPNVISPRGKDSIITAGMITSDEPGVYITGKYGIRIENEILCINTEDGYAFETITFCPYERKAIVVDMLDEAEIDFINKYHSQVFEKISPLLDKDTAEWLEQECAPL